MSLTPEISLQQARNLMLTTLGLNETPRCAASKTDVLSVIRSLGALQIDTIHVVARAHLHILWSRLGNFDPVWVDDLQKESKLFEYYAHAMCYIPIEDYPVYRRYMLEAQPNRASLQWEEDNQAVIAEVRDHLRAKGAVRSSEFERPEKGLAWWDWKSEKRALELLFYRGEVMVAERRSFQRVYSFQEQVLPLWDDQQALSANKALELQVLHAAKALGIARPDWLCDFFYLPKKVVIPLLARLQEQKSLFAVQVKGLGDAPLLVHSQNLELLEVALAGKLETHTTNILSPFDPLVTDRSRAKELFGFDYLIECYTPAPKRVYGYFTLPILHLGKLVGRMDAKAWRKQKRLEIIHLFLEPAVGVSEELANGLEKTLRSYTIWQGLESITVTQTTPPDLKDLLVARLALANPHNPD